MRMLLNQGLKKTNVTIILNLAICANVRGRWVHKITVCNRLVKFPEFHVCVLQNSLDDPVKKTRKRFPEKPVVAFTNNTVFILDFYRFVSCFGLECLEFEESSYRQFRGSLSPYYQDLHARQILHQLSFHSQIIPDCIRYIIGVFCYNFKSQTNILAYIVTLACVKAEI